MRAKDREAQERMAKLIREAELRAKTTPIPEDKSRRRYRHWDGTCKAPASGEVFRSHCGR
jgi:hypothetical protein